MLFLILIFYLFVKIKIYKKMSDNDYNMNMYGVNNSSFSLSTFLIEEDVFTQIKDLVGKKRIDQEMKNDGND
jgi:hypothetical protein